MKCPHCLQHFHEDWRLLGEAVRDSDGSWVVHYATCPACKRLIMKLIHGHDNQIHESLFLPRSPVRAPLSSEVPPLFAADYREACLVESDSPKASAALSRRCLQNLLREQLKVKPANLSDEIDEVLPKLPSHLSSAVDAIRNIGNFAAHPLKSTNTGAIADVEPGEAEWCLEVLESLFDFCFIQPSIVQKKRDALNQKLSEAGKPPMK